MENLNLFEGRGGGYCVVHFNAWRLTMSGGNQKGVYRTLDMKPSSEEHKVLGEQSHARRNKLLNQFLHFCAYC